MWVLGSSFPFNNKISAGFEVWKLSFKGEHGLQFTVTFPPLLRSSPLLHSLPDWLHRTPASPVTNRNETIKDIIEQNIPPNQRMKGVQYRKWSLQVICKSFHISSVSRKKEDKLGWIYKKIKKNMKSDNLHSEVI